MTSTPPKPSKPVLGLFASEDELRDHLAEHLELVEPGLTHLKSEYTLDNPEGAGGRLDILARDPFDHVVCIEIKRSDNSARATLNELSKYISLLVSRDRIPREMIRCMVVSTDWHELLLPLSYFALTAKVDIKAFRAVAEDGQLRLLPQPLKALRFTPQFSPDMDFHWFDDESARARYAKRIKVRAAAMPFVRLALLMFAPTGETPPGRSPYLLAVCVWRLEEKDYAAVSAITGKPIGSEFPYVAEGWEPEADAKNWICDIPDDFPEVAMGWQHGTPEILHNLLTHYALQHVERVGDWPKLEFVNDPDRLLRAALASSPLGGGERGNRHRFEAKVTPNVATSWEMGVEGFLDYIAFEPVWLEAAVDFLGTLTGDVAVLLHAFDKKHLVYAIHQARFHDNTSMSFFEIVVRKGNEVVGGLLGQYLWDGRTCPDDAEAAIETVYGSVSTANWSITSAVDRDRYESALPLHGIFPSVARLDGEDLVLLPGSERGYSIIDFVRENPAYSEALSAVLERQGVLPSSPTGSISWS